MPKSARLIVTYECERNCPGCCNKNWKYEPPEIIRGFDFDEVLITGGEPLLFASKIPSLVYSIRLLSPRTRVYIYTARCNDSFPYLANLVDGMTLTLHTTADVYAFMTFAKWYKNWLSHYHGSLRLNVFRETGLQLDGFLPFQIKNNIEWIKDCPLPENEKLFRLENLWRTR